MDQDSIQPAANYAEVIREKVSSCAVLVAVIGPQWATLTDEKGRRRADDPGDFVRFEIHTALERGIPVIPVLVDGALMPGPEQLPAELQKLAWLQAQELNSGRHYEDDAGDLVKRIKELLATASGTGIGRQSPPAANAGARTDPHDVRPDGNNVLSGVRIGGNTPLGGASLQAGKALNAGTDALAAQVMQTELAAAAEQAQYRKSFKLNLMRTMPLRVRSHRQHNTNYKPTVKYFKVSIRSLDFRTFVVGR